METKTFINDIEFVQYDNFRRILKEIEQEIISQNRYEVYPKLPQNYFEVEKIFAGATDEEKKFMFNLLWGLFVDTLRHWKVDLDSLYTENGRKNMPNFLKNIKLLNHI